MNLSLFAPLKQWEYEALKADIAKRGVLVPIEFDQDGDVVDGRNRLKICGELGRDDYPTIFRRYSSDKEKQLVSIILNTYRRHLTPIRRDAMIEVINDQMSLELDYVPVVPPTKRKQPSASDAPEAVAARQRDHRLEERIKPKNPPPDNWDPWLMADEALELLERCLPYLPLSYSRDVQQAMELIRQLAWGPE